MLSALRNGMRPAMRSTAFARCFSSEGKTVMQVQTETHAWIANNLKSSGSRDDFDKMAAANHINFAQVVEEDIKPSHTLDDYRKLFNAFVQDQPIVVATYDTLEWVVDSPPELHLFEEYPALKLTPDENGNVDQ